MTRTRGFSLIEVLIVITIIGILSSIALASYSQAKEKAQMARRIEVVQQLKTALELYYLKYHAYPSTGGRNAWLSNQCISYVDPGHPEWIPDIVSEGYLASLPTDAEYGGGNKCCYLYTSDGTDYKLMFAYSCSTIVPQSVYKATPAFIDPNRDGGHDSCIQETTGNVTALALYTPGACLW